LVLDRMTDYQRRKIFCVKAKKMASIKHPPDIRFTNSQFTHTFHKISH
jgi:hypothetical protein